MEAFIKKAAARTEKARQVWNDMRAKWPCLGLPKDVVSEHKATGKWRNFLVAVDAAKELLEAESFSTTLEVPGTPEHVQNVWARNCGAMLTWDGNIAHLTGTTGSKRDTTVSLNLSKVEAEALKALHARCMERMANDESPLRDLYSYISEEDLSLLQKLSTNVFGNAVVNGPVGTGIFFEAWEHMGLVA